jgi:hypothetical protein
MSSPLEKFRVGDKVTVHDPLIDEGVVTRVGRKYVTVTPANPPTPWAITEHAALQRISPTTINITELVQAAAAPQPSTAEVRAWARTVGLPVPDRGRLHPDIWQAWHDANDAN